MDQRAFRTQDAERKPGGKTRISERPHSLPATQAIRNAATGTSSGGASTFRTGEFQGLGHAAGKGADVESGGHTGNPASANSATNAADAPTGAMMLKVMDMDGLQVFPVYGKTGEVSGTAMIYLVRDDEDPPTKRVGVEVCVADMVQLLAKER